MNEEYTQMSSKIHFISPENGLTQTITDWTKYCSYEGLAPLTSSFHWILNFTHLTQTNFNRNFIIDSKSSQVTVIDIWTTFAKVVIK